MVVWLSGSSHPIERSRATPDAIVSYFYQRQSPAKSCALPSKAHNCIAPCAPVRITIHPSLSLYYPINKTL
jgi:hypothetical protein